MGRIDLQDGRTLLVASRTADEWQHYDALRDLLIALEEYRSIDSWPKRKRELAVKALRMHLGLPAK